MDVGEIPFESHKSQILYRYDFIPTQQMRKLREGGSERQRPPAQAMTSEANLVPDTTLWVCNRTDLPQDRFLEKHLLGGQEMLLWITDVRRSSCDGPGL